MNLLQRLGYWGDHHHPKWLDIVRFGLGIFLCFKGIQVLENMSTVMARLGDTITFRPFLMSLLGHYVVFAHLLGGILLAVGLLTRFACLIQLPVLLGAIILINAPEVLWSSFSELSLSILGSCCFVIFWLRAMVPGRSIILLNANRKKRMADQPALL